jgi:LuxR family transcriptional regulator, maltose regulon positive regulatory protein
MAQGIIARKGLLSYGAVARPRLVERLNEALANGCRLAMVIAPAGYGKSTLLADWVNASERPAAWLSLDQRDNHLPSFLRYFVAALRSQFPEACPVTARALQAPTLPAPEYLAELLAGEPAGLPQPFILVLDDYHLVRAPDVEACMGRLLEVLPENMLLALVCRFDPSLPLARFGRYRVAGRAAPGGRQGPAGAGRQGGLAPGYGNLR